MVLLFVRIRKYALKTVCSLNSLASLTDRRADAASLSQDLAIPSIVLRKKSKYRSDEADLNHRPKDVCLQLQSSALPAELSSGVSEYMYCHTYEVNKVASASMVQSCNVDLEFGRIFE